MLTRTTILIFAVVALPFADSSADVEKEGCKLGFRQLAVNSIAILRNAADKIEQTYGHELDGLVSNYVENTSFTENLGTLVSIQALRIGSDDFKPKRDQKYFEFSEFMSNDN